MIAIDMFLKHSGDFEASATESQERFRDMFPHHHSTLYLRLNICALHIFILDNYIYIHRIIT